MVDLTKEEEDTVSFDPKAFDPPAWATTGFHRYKGGSSGGPDGSSTRRATEPDDHKGTDDDEDAAEGLPDVGVETDAAGLVTFTTAELKVGLSALCSC